MFQVKSHQVTQTVKCWAKKKSRDGNVADVFTAEITAGKLQSVDGFHAMMTYCMLTALLHQFVVLRAVVS